MMLEQRFVPARPATCAADLALDDAVSAVREAGRRDLAKRLQELVGRNTPGQPDQEPTLDVAS